MNAVHVNPDACIACTTCTVYCPVAAQTEAFPGPRMIGPAYERFRLLGMVEDPSLSWCSNCKNCDIACPQGVSIASINMMARAREYEKAHPHFLRDWIVSHTNAIQVESEAEIERCKKTLVFVVGGAFDYLYDCMLYGVPFDEEFLSDAAMALLNPFLNVEFHEGEAIRKQISPEWLEKARKKYNRMIFTVK